MQYDTLFVYGTLRRGSAAPMQAWLESRAEWLGPARIRGRLYRVGPYPGFVPARGGVDTVRGDLYRIRDPRTWRQLDAHEGIGPGFAAPQEYRRQRLTVTRAEGQRGPAWVYVYNRPVQGLRRLPGGDYLA